LIFGPKYEFEVEKILGDEDFSLDFNIEDTRYTKKQIRNEIQNEFDLINRKDEISRGEII
jgi:hypothetical protein